MFFQALDGMIRNSGGCVVGGVFLNRRLAFVILERVLGREISIMILQTVGAIEAAIRDRPRESPHMPLTGMIGTVASRTKELGEGARPIWHRSFGRVHVDLLGVVSRQDRCPGRPATSGVVKLGEPQPIRSQTIEVGSGNLRTIATEV